MSKPDPKKMAGDFPEDWAMFCDLTDDSIMAESALLLIAKAKMLKKRYVGRKFPKSNVEITDVRVCDLGCYCLFYVKSTGLVTGIQAEAFENTILHETETYFNLKPSFEYNFAFWK